MPLLKKRFKPKVYIKDVSFDPIYKSTDKGFHFRSRVFPGVLMALGFIVLGTQVIIPLIFFLVTSGIFSFLIKTITQ